MSTRITDSDSCTGDEGLIVLHHGENHSPHHPTPGPIPHPEPGPRVALKPEQMRDTGHAHVVKTVKHAH